MNKTVNVWVVAGALIVVLALVLPWSLAMSNDETYEIGDEKISEVCLDCHEDQHSALLGTPHQILIDNDDPALACTSCHAGDKRHYDEDPEEYAMTNPANLGAWNESKTCSQCHTNSHQQNMQEHNVHMTVDVNCSECHQVHAAAGEKRTYGEGQYAAYQYTGLLKKTEVDLCLDCHTHVRAEFHQSTHHPVIEGIVKCSQCHMEYDRTKKPLSFSGTNAACYDCHSEFQMPFPFEHQATVDYSVQEGACLNCHAPHGSNLPRMLKQPYDPPHNQLCSQCHSVPRHNFNSYHSTMWAGVGCNECHVDIHGSYTSRYFFTSEMQSRGCINVGCHQLQ